MIHLGQQHKRKRAEKKPPLPLDREAARAFARHALFHPPADPRIERPKIHGDRVVDFVLPLWMCPTGNVSGHAGYSKAPWALSKLKQEVLLYMLGQHPKRSSPLPGRPQVIAVRFSAVATDDSANGAKIPIDRLTVKRGGLGYITDDRFDVCNQRSWWEPGLRGKGFQYVAVYTGEP